MINQALNYLFCGCFKNNNYRFEKRYNVLDEKVDLLKDSAIMLFTKSTDLIEQNDIENFIDELEDNNGKIKNLCGFEEKYNLLYKRFKLTSKCVNFLLVSNEKLIEVFDMPCFSGKEYLGFMMMEQVERKYIDLLEFKKKFKVLENEVDSLFDIIEFLWKSNAALLEKHASGNSIESIEKRYNKILEDEDPKLLEELKTVRTDLVLNDFFSYDNELFATVEEREFFEKSKLSINSNEELEKRYIILLRNTDLKTLGKIKDLRLETIKMSFETKKNIESLD